MVTAKKMNNAHALTEAEYSVVQPVYNRHIYVSNQSDWSGRSALNLDLDWEQIQQEYLTNNVTCESFVGSIKRRSGLDQSSAEKLF